MSLDNLAKRSKKPSYYRIVTAKAPINIAVIKYWGKSDENLKIPINDSISGTIDLNQMCAKTSVSVSNLYTKDGFWFNCHEQDLNDHPNVKNMLEEVRNMSRDKDLIKYKTRIVSCNNFPTAAGLASSAAGYACLAYVLGQIYGIVNPTILSKIARRGSGSACRSLFGGFVQWERGHDHETSIARQIVDHKHWPEMRVVICVTDEGEKDISSSKGMLRSVYTSDLIRYRAENVVPERIEAMKNAIIEKDFHTFAEITMKESNQFHAICLDSYPPLFYMNAASRQVIKVCSIVNAFYGQNRLAYTFDAGPHACVYVLDDFVNMFICLITSLFTSYGGDRVEIQGKSYKEPPTPEVIPIMKELIDSNAGSEKNRLSRLINTRLGEGPRLARKHIDDPILQP